MSTLSGLKRPKNVILFLTFGRVWSTFQGKGETLQNLSRSENAAALLNPCKSSGNLFHDMEKNNKINYFGTLASELKLDFGTAFPKDETTVFEKRSRFLKVHVMSLFLLWIL